MSTIVEHTTSERLVGKIFAYRNLVLRSKIVNKQYREGRLLQIVSIS
ncbi:hypothetical protein SAPIG1848 [Staphylococcus aureus subsp. aureus ST398]|nr:hypothetical protein SAPIG1848 [Staphylococcus aureus subsp. aureus ST398]